MRVVQVLGRGVEGCGVTKFTVELQSWFKSQGHECRVLATKDKTWSRKNAHVIEDLIHIKFEKERQAVRDSLAWADLIVVNSLPSLSHTEGCSKVFVEELQSATAPIVFFQHDHNKLSMRRNVGTKELLDVAHRVYAHSATGDFAKQVNELYNDFSLDTLLGGEKKAVNIHTFQPAMNFDAVKAKYWRPIEEQDTLLARWIGRTTFWKGFVPMFNLHNNYLKQAGFATIFEGIDKSPAFLDFKTKSPFIDRVSSLTDPDSEDPKLYRGTDAAVYAQYINDNMLRRMSKTAFGFQLSAMDPRFIYRSLEYTHCEVVCAGPTTVFRKSYGSACTHRVTGKKLVDHDFSETGTIWLDENNLEESAYMILQLSKNTSLREDARKAAYEFYRQHQDASVVFPEIFGEYL